MTTREEIIEGVVVNAFGWAVVFDQAKWNAYLGEPGNVVSLSVAAIVITYTALKIAHLMWHWKNDTRHYGK